MSKQKNSISKKIQSDNINDDTSFEDTDEDNDVINEQNTILDFEIFEKTAEEVLSVMHNEWVNDGWSDGPFTDGDAIMKTLHDMNESEEMLDAVDTFLCGALMILNGNL